MYEKNSYNRTVKCSNLSKYADLSNKLSDLDIKNGQYDFFLVISRNEGISQKQLSEYLHIGKATTAKAVKNLVGKGYVNKQKDEIDGRMDHLFLTDIGRKEALVVQKIFKEIIDIGSRGLSDFKIEQLLSLMQKVLENVMAEITLLSKEHI